jgi:PPOX class probable F420-dependent enzyme
VADEPIDSRDGGWVRPALEQARVARLATVGDDGAVRMVPICFALVASRLVSVVDHKPKRTGQLRRLDDITATRRATVLVDHYSDDWTQLWWIRVRGEATVHAASDPVDAAARRALVAKYEQYRATTPAGAVYSVRLDELRWWRY